MTTITTTSTSAASLVPLQMHWPTPPPANQTQGALSVGDDSLPTTSPSALGHALLAAEERLQEGNDRMLDLAFELVHNMGQKAKALKDENARLKAEIPLQQRRIEILEPLHQEKWTAHLEATRVRMHAISCGITRIIRSMETFQAQYPKAYQGQDPNSLENVEVRTNMFHSMGPTVYCRTVGALMIQEAYLPYFKDWLKMTDKPIGKSFEKHPEYMIPPQTAAQTVVAVANPMALDIAGSFPQIARFVQNQLALEREVASTKQELAEVEQLRETKEKDHRGCIRAWSVFVHIGTFVPCLKFANLLQEMLGDYVVKATARILESQKNETMRHLLQEKSFVMPENAGIEEANRLKGMISATLPQIQEAVEWTKREIEQWQR